MNKTAGCVIAAAVAAILLIVAAVVVIGGGIFFATVAGDEEVRTMRSGPTPPVPPAGQGGEVFSLCEHFWVEEDGSLVVEGEKNTFGSNQSFRALYRTSGVLPVGGHLIFEIRSNPGDASVWSADIDIEAGWDYTFATVPALPPGGYTAVLTLDGAEVAREDILVTPPASLETDGSHTITFCSSYTEGDDGKLTLEGESDHFPAQTPFELIFQTADGSELPYGNYRFDQISATDEGDLVIWRDRRRTEAGWSWISWSMIGRDPGTYRIEVYAEEDGPIVAAATMTVG